MKLSLKATSIVEAMIAMMIITLWVTGMYNIYSTSIKLSDSTANKIQAIQIAREGIEAVTNIRDTNWLLFSSDYENCWMVLNYNNTCIGDSGNSKDIAHNGSYLIYQWNDNRWYLSGATTWTYQASADYKKNNRIYLDNNWFYTHSGTTEIKPLFTRVLHFQYANNNSNDPKVEVKSTVYWADSSSSKPHKVELKTTLTNYKK